MPFQNLYIKAEPLLKLLHTARARPCSFIVATQLAHGSRPTGFLALGLVDKSLIDWNTLSTQVSLQGLDALLALSPQEILAISSFLNDETLC